MKNGIIQHKYQIKYIYENYTVNQTTPHLIFYGMLKIQDFVNSEHLYVESTQSLHHLKKYMTGHKKYYSWFILTAELQLNGRTRIPRNSNILSI